MSDGAVRIMAGEAGQPAWLFCPAVGLVVAGRTVPDILRKGDVRVIVAGMNLLRLIQSGAKMDPVDSAGKRRGPKTPVGVTPAALAFTLIEVVMAVLADVGLKSDREIAGVHL